MSRKTTRSSYKHRIDEASRKFTFIPVESDKEGEAPAPKNPISLGGALTNQWKEEKQMFYWPEYRLASSDIGSLYLFAVDAELIVEATKGKEVIFGPVIAKGEESVGTKSMKVVPTAALIVVSVDNKGNISADTTEWNENNGEIPVYDIEYSSKKKGESLTSTPQQGDANVEIGETTEVVSESYSPADYISYEKRMKKAVDAASKGEGGGEVSLDELRDYLRNPSSVKRTTKKGTGKGKTNTLESLVERVDKKRAEVGEDDWFMDITEMTPTLTKGRVKEPSQNHVRALPESDENYNYFILNKKAVESGDENAVNFYKLFTEDAKAAKVMLRAAVKANDTLIETKKKTTKKVSTKSGKTTVATKKSPLKKKVVKPSSESEDEDEEEQEEEKKKPTAKATAKATAKPTLKTRTKRSSNTE